MGVRQAVERRRETAVIKEGRYLISSSYIKWPFGSIIIVVRTKTVWVIFARHNVAFFRPGT